MKCYNEECDWEIIYLTVMCMLCVCVYACVHVCVCERDSVWQSACLDFKFVFFKIPRLFFFFFWFMVS